MNKIEGDTHEGLTRVEWKKVRLRGSIISLVLTLLVGIGFFPLLWYATKMVFFGQEPVVVPSVVTGGTLLGENSWIIFLIAGFLIIIGIGQMIREKKRDKILDKWLGEKEDLT